MTRIYENRGITKRANISIGVLVVVVIWGFWEIWSALRAPALDTTSVLFGVLFIGGGVYGFWRTMADNQDLVASLDTDAATGQAVVTLWRPFRAMTIATPLSAFRGWRFWVKMANRSQRSYELIAEVPDYPRPLRLELLRGQAIDPELRRLAPEPVEDFERETGAGQG